MTTPCAPWWVVLALVRFGCADVPQLRGPPPEAAAASAQARADRSASAAAVAQDDAARLEGVAAGAELAAKLDPTEARMRAAIDARVAAESARAVAEARERNARAELTQAKDAAERALKERKELDRAEAEQRARDEAAADARRARWIAAGATMVSVLIAGLAVWAGVPPRMAIGAASVLAGSAWALPAMLSMPPWTWVVLGVVALGAVVWQVAQLAVSSRRRGSVVVAMSERLDAVESKPHDDRDDWLKDTSSNLRNAVDRLPDAERLRQKRGKDRLWKASRTQ